MLKLRRMRDQRLILIFLKYNLIVFSNPVLLEAKLRIMSGRETCQWLIIHS